MKIINKKAKHDYKIIDTIESELVLTGQEINAIDVGHVNMAGSYIKIKNHQPTVHNLLIGPYSHKVKTSLVSSRRARKVVIERRVVQDLITKITEDNLCLIPLELHVIRGADNLPLVKMAIGLCKPKKLPGQLVEC